MDDFVTLDELAEEEDEGEAVGEEEEEQPEEQTVRVRASVCSDRTDSSECFFSADCTRKGVSTQLMEAELLFFSPSLYSSFYYSPSSPSFPSPS